MLYRTIFTSSSLLHLKYSVKFSLNYIKGLKKLDKIPKTIKVKVHMS